MVMILTAMMAAGAGAAFPELRATPAGEIAAVAALKGTEDRQAGETRRPELRRAGDQILGPLPEQRAPLDTEVVSREELDDHTRLLLRYCIDAKMRTEAYLLLPKPRDEHDALRPAMVCLHPTSKATYRTVVGLEGRETNQYALQLVRRGYVCIAPRNFLWEVEGQTWQQAADRVIADGWKTGMARMVFDAIRATDVLIERGEVDPKRIGTIGHSLGGKEALYHAAFDDRIRAAVSCEGGVGLKFSNWEADWYLGKQIRSPEFGRDNQEVMSLIAPRALLVVGGEQFDGAQSWPFIEACLPVWRLYGAEGRLGLLRHDGKHNLPEAGEKRELMWRWLDEQLRAAG
jgi:dienelactone hydrolase